MQYIVFLTSIFHLVIGTSIFSNFFQYHSENCLSVLGGCINKLSSILYKTATTCTTTERRRNHETSVESIEPPLQRALEQSDETLSRFISDATGAEDWHTAKSVVLKENRKSISEK